MNNDTRVEAAKELNVKQLESSELPQNGSFVDLSNLGKASPWKLTSFEYQGQEFVIECKKLNKMETLNIVTNIDSSPEVDEYKKNLAKLTIDNPADYNEVSQQMYQALSMEHRIELGKEIAETPILRVVNYVRFPQEDGSVMCLSLDGANGTINITDLDPDFVDALYIAFDAINNPSEVKEALDTFPESGGSE